MVIILMLLCHTEVLTLELMHHFSLYPFRLEILERPEKCKREIGWPIYKYQVNSYCVSCKERHGLSNEHPWTVIESPKAPKWKTYSRSSFHFWGGKRWTINFEPSKPTLNLNKWIILLKATTSDYQSTGNEFFIEILSWIILRTCYF